MGRYQDAIDLYRRALKLQPDNTPIALNLGLAYYKTGRIDEAAAAFANVHRATPDEIQPVLLLADCWLNMGENRRLIDLLTPIAARRSGDLAIAYLLGTALIRDGQPARGQAVIDPILRNAASPEARLLLGAAKLQAGDYPGALADLAAAVERNPELPHAWSYYGQALEGTGDPARAAEAFHKALAAEPHDFISNLHLAALLEDEEKFVEARECLRRALLVRPHDVAARYHLASILLREGRTGEARRGLEAIAKEAPSFVEAHVALATAYYRLQRKADGDRERAIVRRLTAEKQARQVQGVNVK